MTAPRGSDEVAQEPGAPGKGDIMSEPNRFRELAALPGYAASERLEGILRLILSEEEARWPRWRVTGPVAPLRDGRWIGELAGQGMAPRYVLPADDVQPERRWLSHSAKRLLT
jgi:hypothetical protein